MGSLGDHAIPGRAGGSTAGPGRDRTSIGPCRSRRAERWDKPTAAGSGRQPSGFVISSHGPPGSIPRRASFYLVLIDARSGHFLYGTAGGW